MYSNALPKCFLPLGLARTLGVTSEPNEAHWAAYVGAHPTATAYHEWTWRHVFERAFGHQTVYLTAREHDEIVGVLPLVLFRGSLFGTFLVSLPFVNYGGVLANDASVAERLKQSAALVARRVGASHIELRHRSRIFPDLPVKSHKVAMRMPLPADVEVLWQSLDRKVRNQIRKADKSRLTTVSGGVDLIDEFYVVFARNMRDLGTPVYSRQLFEEVLRAFPDRARIFVVRHDSRPVAAGITYRHRGTIEMPWASSLRQYRSLCPNNLLYWTAIRYAVAERATSFDFGRSTPEEGTYHFKAQWGGVPEPLHWEYCLLTRSTLPDQTPTNPKFRLAIQIWKRCPLWLANSVGPRVVRSIP